MRTVVCVTLAALLLAGCNRTSPAGGLSAEEKSAAAKAGISEQELLAFRGEARATAKGMGMTDAEADAYVRQHARVEDLAQAKENARKAVEAADRALQDRRSGQSR